MSASIIAYKARQYSCLATRGLTIVLEAGGEVEGVLKDEGGTMGESRLETHDERSLTRLYHFLSTLRGFESSSRRSSDMSEM